MFRKIDRYNIFFKIDRTINKFFRVNFYENSTVASQERKLEHFSFLHVLNTCRAGLIGILSLEFGRTILKLFNRVSFTQQGVSAWNPIDDILGEKCNYD
jgi:hypothetical protein